MSKSIRVFAILSFSLLPYFATSLIALQRDPLSFYQSRLSALERQVELELLPVRDAQPGMPPSANGPQKIARIRMKLQNLEFLTRTLAPAARKDAMDRIEQLSQKINDWELALKNQEKSRRFQQQKEGCSTPVESPAESVPAVKLPRPQLVEGIGSISGSVKDAATSSPLDAHMYLFDMGNNGVADTSTDASGNFLFSQLHAGTYYAKAYPWSGNYAPELYDNIHCAAFCFPSSGTPITVTTGTTTPGIDFILETGGSISGTVTDAASAGPLLNVTITIYDSAGEFVKYTMSDSSGHYSSDGLAAGNYFATTSNSLGYGDELYNNLPCAFGLGCEITTGTQIPVTLGSDTAGIDFALDAGGVITGVATNSLTSAPINAGVRIFDSAGNFVGDFHTNDSGIYTADSLPTGVYFAQTISENLDELYDNLPCETFCDPTTGSAISVTAGATISGIDFALDPGGTVTGIVTDASTSAPISGVIVDLLNSAGNLRWTVTDSSGFYSINGLLTGAYFGSVETVDEQYSPQIYDRIPGHLCHCLGDLLGTPIAVTTNSTTSGIDFPLQPAGTIAGMITESDILLGSMAIDIFDSNGNFLVTAYGDSIGNYSVSGLPTGQYYAIATNGYSGADYIDQLYNGIDCPGENCDPLSGTAISVTAGATTTVDFSLHLGGSISGEVTDSNTSNQIPGFQISIFDSNGFPLLTSFTTDSSGNYHAGGLPTGGYFVEARTYTRDYVEELWDDIQCLRGLCDPASGIPVSVLQGSDTPGIDFALEYGGSISGKITDAVTSAGIQYGAIRMFDSSGNYLGYIQIRAGVYFSTGLATGNYFAVTDVRNDYLFFPNTPYSVDELYDNFVCNHLDCDPTAGTPIPVTLGVNTPNIDFALDHGGSFTGVVVDATTLQPIFEAAVEIFDASGNLIEYAITDQQGRYHPRFGLATGSYYAVAFGLGMGYVPELYDNLVCPNLVCDVLSGTPIAVTAGSITPDINFAISSCAGFDFVTATLPNGFEGVAYSQTLTVAGGVAPFNFAVTSGGLPAGLTLDANSGLISGAPSNGSSGSYEFVITAYDTNGCGRSKVFTLVIGQCATIVLSPSSLPDGVTGSAYNQTLTASGGAAPYTFSVTSGSLPNGLSMDSSGNLSGTPLTPGGFFFTISALDSNGCAGTQDYSITIAAGCLFCDDFEDGSLDPNWTYSKPLWSEANGFLIGATTKKMTAIAAPAFTGCLVCYEESALQISGGIHNRTWMLGWYADKDNNTELLIKQSANAVILKQRAGGRIVAKAKGTVPGGIQQDTPYTIRVTFDGAQFSVTVNQTTILSLAPGAAVNSGTAGFAVKNVTTSFGYIQLN